MPQPMQKKVLAAIFCMAVFVVILIQATNTGEKEIDLRVKDVSYQFAGSNVVATLTLRNHGRAVLYLSDLAGKPALLGKYKTSDVGKDQFISNLAVTQTRLDRNEEVGISVSLPSNTSSWEPTIYVQPPVVKWQILRRFWSYLPKSLVLSMIDEVKVIDKSLGEFAIPEQPMEAANERPVSQP